MTPEDRIREAAIKAYDDHWDYRSNVDHVDGFTAIIAACVADVLDMCEDGSHRDEIAQRIREMK